MIILKNGRLIDPVNSIDQVQESIWIEDGKIVPPKDSTPEGTTVFDLQGKWIVPGLIDMHVHLREPGEEYKETIASGARAAAKGGFTGVACMPNTKPVNDSGSVTRFICENARSCDANIYPVGAISSKSKGSSLAEYGEMKEAGAVALSDDGLPVVDSQLMRRAMEYSATHNMLIISHSEEFSLSRGCMNEGETATRMGLKGIPNTAESIMVYRDIALSDLTTIPIHFAHISTAESIELIREAKKRGAKVTAETAPHYFTLTDEAVEGYNTNAKMNPPLRSSQDREAIRQALADGTFDAIATDHAPHSTLEKELEFSLAANGIIGLETALPLALNLVREKIISPTRLIELMSCNPAKLLKVEGGSLEIGAPANVTVIDPEKKYIFTEESIVSKSKNSPFIGWELTGKAILTIAKGRVTYNDLD